MQKYPVVLFFRYDKYNDVDIFLSANQSKIDCDLRIINNRESLINLFDSNFNVLVTYGPDEKEYHKDVFSVIAPRMARRWIHYKEISNPEEFSRGLNYCYIHSTIGNRIENRPIFSAFTTCYNSYEKIKRPLRSLMAQSMVDWEWVILDDSPDDKHFNYLRDLFNGNKKVRLYKRSENSGNIGNVKNEAASLCRGKYVLELDHDDEITAQLFKVSMEAFEKNPDVGFIYTDFINIYENRANFWYGDFFALGYGGYYCSKYNGLWVNVYVTPQVNNITLRHLVSLPNHARMWRRDVLFMIGNYSEFLPINDDQELLMRTCISTKMLKIPGIGYVQYMNENNSNFSLIRNAEINRIGPYFLSPQFYQMYKIQEFMKEHNAYDDEKYMVESERIWLRDSFIPKYCNKLYQAEYDTQYCIIGTPIFIEKLEVIKELYKDLRNDFFLIDSTGQRDKLCEFLDTNGFERMRCYSIKDLTAEQMERYFNYIYKTAEKSVIWKSEIKKADGPIRLELMT